MLSEKEVDLGQEEDDEEEEEGDKKEDEEGPRSDLTNDYHPNRVSNYVPEQDDLWSVGGSQETLKNEWVVEDFNVTEALKDFQIASAKVTPKILSDMRLLALNSTYLFSLNKSESITNYMDVYDVNDLNDERSTRFLKQVQSDLQLFEGAVQDSGNVIEWAHQLAHAAVESNDWFQIQSITIPFLKEAKKSDNKFESANILHRLQWL